MKNLAIYWNRCLVCDGTERPYLGRGLWLLPIDNEIIDEDNAKLVKKGSFFPFAWSEDSKTFYAMVERDSLSMIFSINSNGIVIDSIYTAKNHILGNMDFLPNTNQFIIEKYREQEDRDLWMLTDFDPNF